MVGDCIREGRAFNLITKERYYNKPTYRSLTTALIRMKELCINEQITKLAMPVIGCGLDRLEWNKVKDLIYDVFRGTDIDILICMK